MKKVKSLCMLSTALTIALSTNLLPLPAVSAQAASAPTTAISHWSARQTAASPYLQSANWAPDAKNSINDFLKQYGNQAPSYDKKNKPYATLDFDNTTSIMDVEEQLMIWQLDHLAFAIKPDKLAEILQSGISPEKLNLTYGANDGSGTQVPLQAAIDDAVKDYTELYSKGLVTKAGRELPADVKNSFAYQDFRAKMRWLYDAVSETMDTSVSYPWVTYWFTGMTPKEIFDLAYSCDSYYGDSQKGQTWTVGKYATPDGEELAAGKVDVSFKQGITVTPEVKELYLSLAANGIDPWIVSASQVDVVKAAVKYFEIPNVVNVVGMTNKIAKDGTYINEYNYDLHAQTQGVGKSLSIEKIIRPLYHGQGPIFCAMDSQGDFNFCTEFKDTKAVLIMNRQRKDDAALCAAIAAFEQKKSISLLDANKNNDVKYILQGRNETIGQLWPEENTQFLGKTNKSFLSERALNAINDLDNGMSFAQMLAKNTKLKDYQGYKTR